MSYNKDQCDSCWREWAIHLTMGCVHEHWGQVRFCAEHRERLNGTGDQQLVCTPCVNDHSCPVHIVTIHTDRIVGYIGPQPAQPIDIEESV